MYDRFEMYGDAIVAIDNLDGWSQLEFGHAPESEEIANVVAGIVWQAALDFIYQQPATLSRDTLIERMRRWMWEQEAADANPS